MGEQVTVTAGEWLRAGTLVRMHYRPATEENGKVVCGAMWFAVRAVRDETVGGEEES